MGRNRFILAAAAVVLLAAAVFTYFSLSGNNTAVDQNQAPGPGTTVAADTAADSAGLEDSASVAGTAVEEQAEPAAVQEPEITKSEDIEVRYNSPEYDLKASLCEDSDKRTFVKLEYYLDGAGTIMEADSEKLPELNGIFDKRTEAGTGIFKVKYAYLNSVLSKVYLQIAGASNAGYEETALYSLNLKDSSIKKLFSYPGKYSDMSFNKDFSLLGYSFDDPPHLSVFQESSLFEILDCKSDEFKVKGSRTASGKTAGAGRDPSFLYDYTFDSWQSNTAARLKQAIFQKKEPDGKPVGQGEVLYDVTKDEFLNPDGSPAANPSSEAPAKAVPAVKGEAEVTKVLTDFYSYLASEKDYEKAMKLLDESFKLQLELLEQFGVTDIVKSDIDTENASMYSEILKAARLDSIVKAELSDNIYTVYYYQTISLNTDSQVRQALTAQLRKVKDNYKIMLIKDADGSKPPFVQ